MKRILLPLLLSVHCFLTPANAGSPKWIKQATKSIVRLYAQQQQGDTLQANAFFVAENGTIIAPFKTIQNARKAWITDVSGTRYEISRVLGFSSTYNVVRLRADVGKKKPAFLTAAKEGVATGTTVFLAPYPSPDVVKQAEKAGTYNYYTLSAPAVPEKAGMPIISEEGQVVAILQTPISAAKAPFYGLDIRLADNLSIKPMDANHSDLRNCRIPKQMPEEEAQAISFLYLISTTDTEMRKQYIDDFIQNFPQSTAGYTQKAELLAANGEYDASGLAYEQGLEAVKTHTDEIHYSRSRTIYSSIMQNGQENTLPETWTLEQAQTDIAAAIAANPLPLYSLHEANLLFAQKQYAQAYERYMSLTRTPMRSAELFMYAWQCQQNMGADNETLLALNDSAVACFTKPYGAEAAPYLYLRSQTLQEMGRVREAINNLNDYEHLMQGQLTAKFYYQREQLEVRTRMFAQALNDIHRAITLEDGEPLYHAELASLLIRLNHLDEAIEACQKAIALAPDLPDAYRLWGICLREKGDTAAAKAKLEQAANMGDPVAKEALEKIQ